jgi:hypothetical protein
MLDIDRRISAFAKLGRFMRAVADKGATADGLYSQLEEKTEGSIRLSFAHNGWFTDANVRKAFSGIASYLQEDKLHEWLSAYPELKGNGHTPKRIGVIMAGNIPMVGFHDMLCVLLSGNTFIGKLSSSDTVLMPHIAEVLVSIEPAFKEMIVFTMGKLQNIDAIIATGSDNTARYFDHYFGKYPHIIRRNRNSVAVLDGSETEEQLKELAKDIFQYFGLGCRNVSKLYVPEDYDLDRVFKAIYGYKDIVDNKKYGNNYDYNKTVYLLNGEDLLENGFVLLKKDKAIASPVATIFYERYSNRNAIRAILEERANAIQCVVSNSKDIGNTVGFGQTQCPEPWDYADGVDTMKFLLGLQE